MSKKSSATKTAGKIFAAVTVILLMIVFASSVYVGGMKRTAEKFCASFASGSYSDYEKVILPVVDVHYDYTDNNFKENTRTAFEHLPEFSELEETDIISSKMKIRECRMDGSYDQWSCTADVDYFCSGMSVSYKNVKIELSFSQGKWRVRYSDLPFFSEHLTD